MKESNTELFKGQEVFVGMDVHKNSWKITELYGSEQDMTLFFLLDELLKQRTQKLAIVQTQELIIRQLGKEKILHLLMTIPGIGIRTAMLLIAEIWDIKRFKSSDDLCAYVGFAPRLVGSGKHEHIRGSGLRKNKQLHEKVYKLNSIQQ